MRLLLIDDDRLSRSLMADGLRSRDFDVTQAQDAVSAITAFQEDQFNYVVTDIILPDTNGLELAGQLRSMYGSQPYDGPPIIALTGNVLTQKQTLQYLKVFDLVLSKPTSVDDMALALLRLRPGKITNTDSHPTCS